MIYEKIISKSKEGTKSLAVLVDPGKLDEFHLLKTIELCVYHDINYFFVGGSFCTLPDIERTIGLIKGNCDIPVISFPGNPSQLSAQADAILYLSMLSSRNPETLIGHQIQAAPYIKKLNIESISCAYLLIGDHMQSSVAYMSNSMPIPGNQKEIALSTAWAGELLGMRLTYIDAGSGATSKISHEMIKTIADNVQSPLIVGGGLRSAQDINDCFESGADIAVIGNAIEHNIEMYSDVFVEVNNFRNANFSRYQHTEV